MILKSIFLYKIYPIKKYIKKKFIYISKNLSKLSFLIKKQIKIIFKKIQKRLTIIIAYEVFKHIIYKYFSLNKNFLVRLNIK